MCWRGKEAAAASEGETLRASQGISGGRRVGVFDAPEKRIPGILLGVRGGGFLGRQNPSLGGGRAKSSTPTLDASPLHPFFLGVKTPRCGDFTLPPLRGRLGVPMPPHYPLSTNETRG